MKATAAEQDEQMLRVQAAPGRDEPRPDGAGLDDARRGYRGGDGAETGASSIVLARLSSTPRGSAALDGGVQARPRSVETVR